MSIDTQGLEWAQKFHETYERIAPEFGYTTRADTRQFESESKNGQLMIAVCGEIGREIEAAGRAEALAQAAECCYEVARQTGVPVDGDSVYSIGQYKATIACAAAIRQLAAPVGPGGGG